MTIRWAGDQTRETVRCADCSTKRRPLKWYEFWSAWMCPRCTEIRITKEMQNLWSRS